MKKTKKIAVNIPYQSKKSCNMSKTELCKWFSLMNMLKFINHGENICGVEAEEDDIPHSCMLKYVNTVSGDLERYLEDYGGIPFKYSLDTSHSDSKIIEELTMTYH